MCTTTEGTFLCWFSGMGLKLASDISTERREGRIKPTQMPSGRREERSNHIGEPTLCLVPDVH